MAKKFMYVCIGLFLLALSYHLGARSATAQVGTSAWGFSVGTGGVSGADGAGEVFVMTPNGDVYGRHMDTYGTNSEIVYLGNFWGGGPTSTQSHTLGRLKARYR